MIKKNNRLAKNNDFDRIFKTGRSAYSQILGVKAAPNNLSFNRYGFLVGIKVSKKAVERNKVKRRLKAIVSKEEPNLVTGWDFVFISFPLILAKNYEEIKKTATSLLKRIKAYE
ncbi:MAG TPA: ribonuclease P protein component [bacterium]|nr:ribonuclease P protein component [bacterium]